MNDADGAARRDALERAYRASVYVIHDGEQRIETCIDRPHRGLAALLERQGVDCAALLSACNPHSRSLPPEQNLARQQALEDALRAAGLRFLPALGRSPDGSWQEPSVLVLGLDTAAACRWAARWEQHAIVHYDAGGRGALCFVDACGSEDAR